MARNNLQRAARNAVRYAARYAEGVAAGIWLAVYALIVSTGQSFLPGYLDFGWQIIPWTILKARPLTSVWYLHTQPPLWNLIMGVLGRLTPISDARTLQLLQVALGVLLTWLIARILRGFGLRARWIIVLAVLVTVNPEVMRNAFEPTYELATAVGLALAVRALQRLCENRRPRDYVWLSIALTAVVLTRSLYHPAVIPVVLVAVGIAFRPKISRRALLAVALIPTVLVGGWMAKNKVLFDHATMSSWVGMNLQRSTIPILPLADLQQLRADGKVSKIAEIGPFGNYGLYRDAMPPCTPTHSDPALTVESHLDAAGVIIPNFNYECFLPVFDQAGEDFQAVLSAYPRVWLRGRLFSLKMTFATSNLASDSKSPVLRRMDQGFRLLRLDVSLTESTLDWGTPLYGRFSFPFRLSLSVIALYATLAIGALTLLISGLRRRTRAPSAQAAVVVLVGFLSSFTVVVGAIGELGEQARFRSMTDPVALAVGVVVITRLLRRWLGGPQVVLGSSLLPAVPIHNV